MPLIFVSSWPATPPDETHLHSSQPPHLPPVAPLYILHICGLEMGFVRPAVWGRHALGTVALWNEPDSRPVENMAFVHPQEAVGRIATVYTVLSMLSDEHLERDEFKQMSVQLLSQVNNLQNNIASLLEWSKNQFADPVTRKESINLLEVVGTIYDFLKPQFQFKSVELNKSALQPMQLLADKRQLEVILRNLLSNAVKFSHPDSTV